MKVAVCVCTLDRPRGLARTLEAIGALIFRDPAPEVEVVVVDNDPAGSAAPVCAAVCETFPWPLRHCVEPERGIPQARNRAIREVGSADFVAFVDDDEAPAPRWLDELLSVASEFSADVVTGPAISRFEYHAPPWAEDFFTRQRHSTGTRVPFMATNNVLFRADLLRRLDPVFDPAMALTGGSDTHLSLRLARMDVTMVWADGAEVVDYIPRSRATIRWILIRSFRSGATMSIAELDVRPTIRTVALRMVKGIGRIGQGVVMLLPSLVRGRGKWLRPLQSISRGLGTIAGASGVRYEEYRRIHGS